MKESEGLHRPPESNIIPDGVSMVRFIVAASEGDLHVSYRTLEETLADRDAAIIFEADSGGQILLSCPAREVHTDPGTLRQLLCDLERITWGGGYEPDEANPSDDAGIYFEHLPVGQGVTGGMGGGLVAEGVWLHAELDELGLRPQIEGVIAGRLPRLVLPPKFPHVELQSLAEARQYPLARVLLISTVPRRFCIVNALAQGVRVEEARLIELIHQLDAIDELATKLGTDAQPRILIRPAESDRKRGGGHHIDSPLILYPGERTIPISLERNRQAILSILSGTEAPIE